MDPAKREKAIALADEVGAIFKRYPVSADMPPAIARELEGKMAELSTLTEGKHLDELRGEHSRINSFLNDPVGRPAQPGDGGGARGGLKDVGTAFIESKAFRQFDVGRRSGPSADIGLKTLLTETLWAPQSMRIPRIEPYPMQPLSVLDAFAQGTTSEASIVFMEETTATNAAAEVAEGGTKGESALAMTERTSPVRTIATWLPVTVQLMGDVAACKSFVNDRLSFFVRSRLDSQLLNGDGTAPNISGILDQVGLQTQAKGADPTFDAIQKAVTKVQAIAFYQPDTLILHPNDWSELRLTRTADGIYILGAPTESDGRRLWGLNVIPTTAITEGTGLVGAFRTAASVYFRGSLEIAVSDSHSDYFIRNQLAIRAEVRVALAVFRPSAFCTITGI